MNLLNVEYWRNNLLKSYIYLIGIITAVLLPIALIVDTFVFPILGRGPHAKKRTEDVNGVTSEVVKEQDPRVKKLQ